LLNRQSLSLCKIYAKAIHTLRRSFSEIEAHLSQTILYLCSIKTLYIEVFLEEKMLEKLAKQTAIYGISTIAVRFLSYLLTPFFTRVFGQETYGIVTDVYALIPFALVVLLMGLESAYFRFAARADAEASATGGTTSEIAAHATANKRKLFATTWGATLLSASIFLVIILANLHTIARYMGKAYAQQPSYVVCVALIVWFDVAGSIPFSRLREQGRALTFVGIKALNILVNVLLAFSFGFMGFYHTSFGVGWVFVANLVASVVTFLVVLTTTNRTLPRIDRQLFGTVMLYSLPLLISGIAGTANEFIDRQMIKYLVPAGAMAQLGIYGAVTKIAVVMMLFTQMYRLAAEPFFLADYKKRDFLEMNAAALKYYIMASVFIFLGIALFKDLFAFIVGSDFREGIFILPVVLGANVLSGVWLNLSFWYKREERTSLAMWITFTGLVVTIMMNVALVPALGYVGAAWARLASEAAMVAVSYWLNRRFYPTPYDIRRIGEYVLLGLGLFFISEFISRHIVWVSVTYLVNFCLFVAFGAYAVYREQIDLKGLLRAVIKR
jgi:O-antigen/teichoic acid export membrane protein